MGNYVSRVYNHATKSIIFFIVQFPELLCQHTDTQHRENLGLEFFPKAQVPGVACVPVHVPTMKFKILN